MRQGKNKRDNGVYTIVCRFAAPHFEFGFNEVSTSTAILSLSGEYVDDRTQHLIGRFNHACGSTDLDP